MYKLNMNPTYIPRNEYIHRIQPFIGKNIIKVLVGQRRVGKSYLLIQLMDEVKKIDSEVHCIFINKESLEFDRIKDYKDVLDYVNQHKKSGGKNALFIDEIQDILEFEKAFANYALSYKHSAILFAMYDNKKYDHIIWKVLYPTYSKPFKTND